MKRAGLLPLVLLPVALAGCASRQPAPAKPNVPPGQALPREESAYGAPAANPVDTALADRIRRECGIEIVSLRSTAGGDLLELRYRVTDVEAARLAFSTPARLVNEASGQPLTVPDVPRMGSLAAKPRTEGKVHFALFHNPDRQVTPGARVKLVLAGREYPGLVVR